MSGKWASSTRRARLPKDWPQRVKATKIRARGRCEATIHDPRCNGLGSECDHRADPDNHDDLQWLNHYCHAAKTQREAQAARHSHYRTKPPHPGVIT